MSTKFCGLCSSTTTANATTFTPLRPRAVKLREAVAAVQKWADESQAAPSAKPKPDDRQNSSSPSRPKTKSYDNRTRNRRQSNERDRRSFDNKFSEKRKQHDKGEGDLRALGTSRNKDFEWAREDQLSVILEILESEAGTRKNTPNWSEKIETSGEFPWEKSISEIHTEQLWIGKGKGKSVATSTTKALDLPRSEKGSIDWGKGQVYLEREKGIDWARGHYKGYKDKPWESRQRRPSWGRVRFEQRIIEEGERLLDCYEREERERTGKMSDRRTPESPRPIQPPPRDLESISRIDASLVFEHFTTEDAWLLGSALRTRLLPISTPVVINIALANQNQTLFHTCTHSGVMPDNDSWVARKRKTVLRWGCSTWYMHCKFGGDEVAFREKYGLGNSAGEYAIHGGGVPIRVTGVEGVVAVVVVSGLKQDEDHGVVVEVIRELYY